MGLIFEEGDDCPICGGKFKYIPQGECTCHITAPCPACTETPLMCDTCGTRDEDIEEVI